MNPGAQKKFFDYGVKLGLYVDSNDQQTVSNTINKQLRAIKQMTNDTLKDTIWGKDWLTEGMSNAFGRSVGNFAKNAKDLNAMFKNVAFSMKALQMDPSNPAYQEVVSGFSGLTKMIGNFSNSAIGSMEAMGVSSRVAATVVSGSLAAATLGITALIAGLVLAGKMLYDFTAAAIGAREEMKRWDKILVGISTERLFEFNARVNMASKGVTDLGIALSDVKATIENSLVAGLTQAEATNTAFLKTVIMTSQITGEGKDAIIDYYNTLTKATRISSDEFGKGVDLWAKYNNSITKTSKLAAMSFNEYKTALVAAKQDLVLAQSAGSRMVQTLQSDLIGLSAVAKQMNLDVGEIVNKFQESANLITQSDSKFRTLLLVSGGANLNNLLTGTFNRTDALLKAYDHLQVLNKQLGGNLNLTAQIAENMYGLSKEQTLTFLSQNREMLLQAKTVQSQLDAYTAKNAGVEKNWKNFTNTLGEGWQKLKNILQTEFFKALDNPALQNAINRFASLINKAVTGLGDDKLTKTISKVFNWIAENIGTWIDKLYKFIDGDVVTELLDKPGGLTDKLEKWAKDLGSRMVTALLKGVITTFHPIAISLNLTKYFKDAIFGLFGKKSESGQSPKNTENADSATQYTVKALGNQYSGSLDQVKDQIRKFKSADLERINEKLERYNGLQDTDVVYTTNKTSGQGEWTTVGSVREDLEKQRDEVQKKIKDTLESIDTRIQTLVKQGTLDGNGNVVQPPTERVQAPPAASPSPAAQRAGQTSREGGWGRK